MTKVNVGGNVSGECSRADGHSGQGGARQRKHGVPSAGLQCHYLPLFVPGVNDLRAEIAPHTCSAGVLTCLHTHPLELRRGIGGEEGEDQGVGENDVESVGERERGERETVSGEGGGNYPSRCDDRACERAVSMSQPCVRRLHKGHAEPRAVGTTSPCLST